MNVIVNTRMAELIDHLKAAFSTLSTPLIANLIEENVLHTDETGININEKKQWLHDASSLNWTYLSAHERRGHDAMDAIGILPQFNGVMC
jgi:transposase